MEGVDFSDISSGLNGNRERILNIISDFICLSLDVVRSGEDRTQDYKWLAEESGVPRRAINAYALGHHIPEDARFAKISRALGAEYESVEDLINDPNLHGM